MNFEELSESEREQFAELKFKTLSSPIEVKNWIRIFLELEIPMEITDPDSNSSPLDAIWQIYKIFKDNSGDINPGIILMSCREGLKTIGVSILELLLLMHFSLDIGHASSTEEQSQVALSYLEGFLLKVEPFMLLAGWTKIVQNKRLFKFRAPGKENKQPYIKVVICSTKGMNSLHSNVLFLDELDLADPKALKEGVNITGFSKGIHGVKVYLSTRKYAFGNMSAAIENAVNTNFKLINWNLIDLCESCPPTRHKPEGPKQDMYVCKTLPLQKITKAEFNGLPPVEQIKFELLSNVHQGCVTCPLLPVCKTRLANKPATATGGFYKPIVSVIQKFAENDPDTAQSQLMCWQPGSTGLVYPRFSASLSQPIANRNVYTIREAYEALCGPLSPKVVVNEATLLSEMLKADIVFSAGVDWGYTHPFVICIIANIPNGDVWLMDTYSTPGLEFDDQLEVAKTYRDKYKVQRWFVDQAMPGHIKSFRKNGMPCPKFTKDVLGGIEAVRSKIVSANGKRQFRVILNDANKKAITAIQKHRFMLDGQGNATLNPDDCSGISDIADSIRYVGQCTFPIRGPRQIENVWINAASEKIDPNDPEEIKKAAIRAQHENQMKANIAGMLGNTPTSGGTGKKGGFFFNF